LGFLGIDIPLLHIRTDQFYLQPFTNIDAFESIAQPAFDGGLKDADPCSFF
jgi:hypothetical protein